MAIRMIRKPSADYIVKAGTNYYAPDDTNLTQSLGTLTEDYPASMFNLEYGKINMEYLVSAKDMVMQSGEGAYNTVSNVDDIIPFRYAYVNQNGYVQGKGLELDGEVIGSTFKVNSGRVVLQGVESDIDASGISFEIDNINGIMYYTIYYRVDLANNSTSIEIINDPSSFKTMTGGDDLTHNPLGVANLDLYYLLVENGVVKTTTKAVKRIEYGGEALKGYDISKGTLEERLTGLGFKEGNIEEYGGNVVGKIIRQGNFVVGTLDIVGKNMVADPINLSAMYYIRSENFDTKIFEPKDGYAWIMALENNNDEQHFDFRVVKYDESDIRIYCKNALNYDYVISEKITFGYEAKPIE